MSNRFCDQWLGVSTRYSVSVKSVARVFMHLFHEVVGGISVMALV